LPHHTAISYPPPHGAWVILGTVATTIALLAVGALLASVAYGDAGQTQHGSQAQAPAAVAPTHCNGEPDASMVSAGPLLRSAD
jgi:hypothetical protein